MADPLLTNEAKLAIRTEVEKILDRELSNLKQSGKILSWLFGVVVALLGWLGFATFRDLAKGAKDIVTVKVTELINSQDSETGVKSRLAELVNRSVITAHLLDEKRTTQRNLNPHAGRVITVSSARPQADQDLDLDDWKRLGRWIQDPTLSESDFTDALLLLGRQGGDRVKQDCHDFLAAMVNPPEKGQFSWMRGKDSKRRAILEVFRGAGLESAALQIVLNRREKLELRIASLGYLSAVNFRPAARDLLPLVQGQEEQALKDQALYTCASLDPLSSEMVKLAQSVANDEKTGKSDAATDRALKLAAAIWYAPVTIAAKGDDLRAAKLQALIEGEKLTFSSQLIAPALQNQRAFVIKLNDQAVGFYVNALEPYKSFGVSIADFLQFKPYWGVLAQVANKGQLALVGWMAPRSALQEGLWALAVAATSKGSLKSGKDSVDASHASRIVLARTVNAEAKRKWESLELLWTDTALRDHEGPLTDLQGTGFEFTFPDSRASTHN